MEDKYTGEDYHVVTYLGGHFSAQSLVLWLLKGMETFKD